MCLIPDLRLSGAAHDDHIPADAGVVHEALGQGEAELLVGIALGRIDKEQAGGTGFLGDGQLVVLVGQLLPALLGVDGEAAMAAVDADGHIEGTSQFAAQLGGNEEPVLVIQLRGVLADHIASSPLHFGAILLHFAPPSVYTNSTGKSTTDFRKIKLFSEKSMIFPVCERLFDNFFKKFAEKRKKNVLCIRGYREKEDDIIIIIEDNGAGIEAEKLGKINEALAGDKGFEASAGIGLRNVNARIKNYYGEDCGIWLESDCGKFTRVYLKIRELQVS